jgi:hypothetical protein
MIRPSSCSADVAPAAVVAVAEDQLAGGHEPREQFRQRDRLARRDMPADPRGEAGHAHGDEGLVHGPSTNWSSPATPSDTSENRNSAGVVHDTSMSYRARGGCRDIARDPVFSRIASVFGPAAPPARSSSRGALPPQAAPPPLHGHPRGKLCPPRPPRSPFLVGHHRDASRSLGHFMHAVTGHQTCRRATRRHLVGSPSRTPLRSAAQTAGSPASATCCPGIKPPTGSGPAAAASPRARSQRRLRALAV